MSTVLIRNIIDCLVSEHNSISVEKKEY